jgi:hypothetical protein
MAIQIKTKSPSKIKVRTQIAIPENLSGIDNIDVSDINDGYVLMYSDTQQRYVFMDPDELLSKSVEDNFLPSDFIQKLDTELNNRIDVDAGEF